MNDLHVARTLGCLSIGLGLAGLLAPDKTSRMLGTRRHRGVLQTVGVRELISGIGLLATHRPKPWLWSRLAGDLMDLALLGSEFSSGGRNRRRLTATAMSIAAVTLADFLASAGSERLRHNRYNHQDANRRPGLGGRHLRKSIIINRSPSELYEFWRDFENLPRFMPHLKSIRKTGENRWQWIVKGPAGSRIEWQAEIVDDTPGELIVWRTLPGSTVEHTGTVRFQPATGNRGTLVRVNLQYRPPGGKAGAAIARMFAQAPETQIPISLFRFKQLMETGEIATTKGQPDGRAGSTSGKFDAPVRA